MSSLVHIELTEEGDEDFEPNTFVAYCGECEACVAWRTLTPLSDWLCSNGPSEDVKPVTTPGEVICPGCCVRTWLPTLHQLLIQVEFHPRLKQIQFEPSLQTALVTHRLKS
jgi:hypothetical protein